MDTTFVNDIQRAALYGLRHYVCFSYYARSPEIFAARDGMAYPCFCSAFVMESRGFWFLVTAGHVLDGVEEERKQGIEHASFRLFDGWGAEAVDRHYVPFDYENAPKHRIHEEGLDYGLVLLGPNAVANMQANNVVPVSEAHYEKIWPERFDGYAIVGTPAATVELKRHGERSTLLRHSVVIIQVAAEPNPPAELIQPQDRFYGRIATPEDSSEWQAIGGDIRGMSGGPILGVRRDDKGLHYWVVGIQSGWLESKRIIAACWFQRFAQFVGQMLDGPPSLDRSGHGP